MAQHIQIRRDTEENWSLANPILLEGEIAYSTDVNRFKVGNGISDWLLLEYVDGIPEGGTAGQILKKVDGSNYNVEWVDNSVSEMFSYTKEVVEGFESEQFLVSWDGPWYVTTAQFKSGSKSLRSTSITGGTSESVVSFRSYGTGSPFSFWYKYETEKNYDKFTALLDGVTIISAVSGSLVWTKYSTTIDSGNHTLTLRYSKDGSGNTGLDAVFIDDITFTSGVLFSENSSKLISVGSDGETVSYVDAPSIATNESLGMIRAKPKSTETGEVAIDPLTGKLYSQVPESVPAGGLTGQVLKKVDDTDYNAEWSDNTFTIGTLDGGDSSSVYNDEPLVPSGGGSSSSSSSSGYPVDVPTVPSNSMDDEFKDEVISPKWVWVNQGTSTARVDGGRLLITIAPGTDVSRGLVQNISDGDFVATARVGMDATIENYYGFGLGLFNSANNRYAFIGKRHSSGVSTVWWCKGTTTSWSSEGILGGYGAGEVYVKIERVGNTINFYYSSTGYTWHKILSESVSTWVGAVTGIGLMGFRNQTDATHVQLGICDWFRVVKS